jgi:hypothetical protein
MSVAVIHFPPRRGLDSAAPNGGVARMTAKLTVQVESFTPRRSNTLRGFVSVTVPELRLKIFDLTVHEKNAARWIGMPGRAQITRDGRLRKDENGKTLYTPTLEFTDRATRDAFSARVIQSLLEFAPAAFDDEEAA